MAMKNLFLTASGLTERTAELFWNVVKREPANVRAILVPSAAVENDAAREGIIVCMERLVYMGIPQQNILLYHLAYLLSQGYARTYSSYVQDIPVPLRLMSAEELQAYDMIVFCGGNASTLLRQVRRTGFAEPLRQAVENGLVYLGISAGSMIAAGNFPDGLGYLDNPLIPHAEKGSPCGEVRRKDWIALADGQAVYIRGNRAEIIG